MNVKRSFNLFILLIAFILVFSFNSEAYAKTTSKNDNRVVTFLVATDAGIIPFNAHHSYEYYEVYDNMIEIVASEHGTSSYYRAWGGWAVADLYTQGYNTASYYNSSNSYVGSSGLLNGSYSGYYPGDAESISAGRGYKLITIPTRSGTSETTFSLICDDALTRISSIRVTLNLN